MSATKSTANPARVAANRANAAKSTGPRTEAGKARSRANAVKHGLTGAGVALPGEDAALVEALFLDVQEQMAPETRLGAELAHDVALLTVRKHRARAAQAAGLRIRARHAAIDFDRTRAGQADRLLDAIEAHPGAYRRELLKMPEGVDRLIGALEGLLDDLIGAAPYWSRAHHQRLDALFGYRPADLPRGRPTRFSQAVLGDFDAIGDAEVAAIPEGESRHAWAAERLVEVIDAEIDRLQAHRLTLDEAAIAQDRLDAALAARFDPGREAQLAARYEAAAARELSRTLRDFHLAEALGAGEPLADLAPEPEPEVTPVDPISPPGPPATGDPNPRNSNEMSEPLASFGAPTVAAPAEVAAATEPAPIAAAAAPTAPRRPCPTVAFTPPRPTPGR